MDHSEWNKNLATRTKRGKDAVSKKFLIWFLHQIDRKKLFFLLMKRKLNKNLVISPWKWRHEDTETSVVIVNFCLSVKRKLEKKKLCLKAFQTSPPHLLLFTRTSSPSTRWKREEHCFTGTQSNIEYHILTLKLQEGLVEVVSRLTVALLLFREISGKTKMYVILYSMSMISQRSWDKAVDQGPVA